jgi:hypothetical protein
MKKNKMEIFYTWPYLENKGSDELLNPLGTVEPNPADERVNITMSFHE